ncbi:MAG: class I SAM-dependent methyltransferase [Candidatus Sericytochromatia bacterium]
MSNFSIIANKYLEINNPISKSKIEQVINLLNLEKNAKVVDIGGGKGLILKIIFDKYDINGLIIEKNSDLLVDIEKNLINYKNNLEIELKSYDEFITENQDITFDCIICIGSIQAISNNYEEGIKELSKKLKTGGKLLIGQGYWKKEPETKYLENTGINKNELLKYHENIEIAQKYNFSYLYSITASEDEFDNFEGLFNMAIKDYCFENKEVNSDEKVVFLERITKWNNNYVKYGRETMGFALYLYRKI